jgi:hypothetical protein
LFCAVERFVAVNGGTAEDADGRQQLLELVRA